MSDIKARLSVEDVVGSYLSLRKSGQSYKALSPFKTEKTPSLVVTPAKEMWKDFSSGKGGDMFRFVMEHEGVEFKEALRILADKAGLNPDDYRRGSSNPKVQNLRKEAYKVLNLAADFYAAQFKKSMTARQYIDTRGFRAEVVNDFKLGYAPRDWQSLFEHLKTLKVPLRQMALAGLVKKRPVPEWLAQKEGIKEKERWGDFFGDRLMIPLSDPQGQVIGFTARLLKDKEGIAKYVNSQQTILYNKSKHVFGYFQAKEAIRKSGFALVVEGNLDVVACHQAGHKQTVAAGGTALTVDHLKIISRLTKDVRLAFDGDAAGTQAMERSLKSAQVAKVNLSIVSLPQGFDPDDLIKQNLSLWQKIVQDHQPAPEWLYEKYKSQLNLQTATGKKALTDVMLPIIHCLNDEVEKDHYMQKLEEIGISRNSLDKKLKTLNEQKDLPSAPPPSAYEVPTYFAQEPPTQQVNKITKMAKIHLLLGLLLIEPHLRDLDEQKLPRLQAILQNYKHELKLYKFLLESSEIIEDVKRLPAKLEQIGECITGILDIVHKIEGGRYQNSEFSTKKQSFDDLFQQLDIMHTREERMKRQPQ